MSGLVRLDKGGALALRVCDQQSVPYNFFSRFILHLMEGVRLV